MSGSQINANKMQLKCPDFTNVLQQSLCSEMAEELRFAVRCHGSRQRPALKRSCTRCSPGTTYVPAALEIPHINGVSEYLHPSLGLNRLHILIILNLHLNIHPGPDSQLWVPRGNQLTFSDFREADVSINFVDSISFVEAPGRPSRSLPLECGHAFIL
jgi:hypothetical protein